MADKALTTHADRVKSPEIRRYLYLDLSIDELVETMSKLTFTEIGGTEEIPFNASVRGYAGATDSDGDAWLVKPIPADEMVDHKYQEVAYYIDFELGTLAAPNIVKEIDSVPYRATKIVKNALQISSYEYFNEPFKSILAADLLNRWLFFDEDRNPNNYLVLRDTDQAPLVIVIDYNKADLMTNEMKITGNSDRFGWKRLEKTRFLTLLKPDNFASLSLETFESRLHALSELTPDGLHAMSQKAFEQFTVTAAEAERYAEILSKNITSRRDYITDYFRTWFKPADKSEIKKADDRYAGLGQSFLDYYKK